MKEYVNFELIRGGTSSFKLALVPVTDTHCVLGMVVGGAWIRMGGASPRGKVLLADVVNESVHVIKALVTHSASQGTHPLAGERLKEVVELGHSVTYTPKQGRLSNYEISSCKLFGFKIILVKHFIIIN